MKLAARALLPAFLAAAALWFADAYGMRSSPANPLLLVGCYLLGFGILLYAEKGLKMEPTPRFYLYYAGLALLSGLLAASFLRQPLVAALNSFLILPVAMLILPAVFQAIFRIMQERQGDVQAG